MINIYEASKCVDMGQTPFQSVQIVDKKVGIRYPDMSTCLSITAVKNETVLLGAHISLGDDPHKGSPEDNAIYARLDVLAGPKIGNCFIIGWYDAWAQAQHAEERREQFEKLLYGKAENLWIGTLKTWAPLDMNSADIEIRSNGSIFIHFRGRRKTGEECGTWKQNLSWVNPKEEKGFSKML
jgi:hypothetical protein